ncbi:MAG TPA: MarR family transcriptional regulator [Casimicrobiaceae bacterium]|nr:MarR family transcriptional regulator [Casimicrobiaceae bacterium]
MTPPKAAALRASPESSLAPAAARHGITRLINRVRVELIDALDRELAPYDISAPQLIVLASVASGEADSAAGLCKSISYDPGAMTRMIDRLEQKGLVRRIPHPEDRRATNLELTVAGKALYPRLIGAKEAVTAQFLRGFSKDEIAMLEGFLLRMIANR